MLNVKVVCGLKNEEYWHILNPKIQLTDTEIEASPAKSTRSIYTDY